MLKNGSTASGSIKKLRFSVRQRVYLKNKGGSLKKGLYRYKRGLGGLRATFVSLNLKRAAKLRTKSRAPKVQKFGLNYSRPFNGHFAPLFLAFSKVG